jgi:hypothetical protein
MQNVLLKKQLFMPRILQTITLTPYFPTPIRLDILMIGMYNYGEKA